MLLVISTVVDAYAYTASRSNQAILDNLHCSLSIKNSEPVYVEVKVPVAVPCDPGAISAPAFAVDRLPIDSSIDKQMQAKGRTPPAHRLRERTQGCC